MNRYIGYRGLIILVTPAAGKDRDSCHIDIYNSKKTVALHDLWESDKKEVILVINSL